MAREEFMRSIEKIEPPIIEKMIRVGAFNLGCGCWYDEILIEKGFEIPNLTYTAFLRRLICAMSGERYVFSCGEWACPVTYAKCRDFIETYNQVLISKPWMLDVFSEAQTKSFITEVLDENLTPKESEILQYRFGFIDGKPWDLKKTGDKFGITSERVRQIEAKALRKVNPRRTGGSDIAEWYGHNASVEIIKDLESITEELTAKAEETYRMLNALEDVIIELKKNPEYRQAEKAKKILRSTKPDPIDDSRGTIGAKCIEIADLNFSVRTYNCLAKAQVRTVRDILRLNKSGLNKVRCLGSKGMAEIEAKLLSLGLELRDN